MYSLHWITDHLATGHAPMSYEDLDSIRSQGISSIVNLCGEFCDLHQIEESSGFEVYYLPVVDECAPDLAAMEQALDWLDEAIYLDKKVLVHCRMGQGRTGTFIAAYLLRRGFAFKSAEQTMKGKIANPTTFAQRRFLKRYGRQVTPLATGAPRIDNRPTSELTPLLNGYRALIGLSDRQWATFAGEAGCGKADHPCCGRPFDLSLVEAMALSQAINRGLKAGQRQQVIEQAQVLSGRLRQLHHRRPGLRTEELLEAFPDEPLHCPLQSAAGCLLYDERPARCRYWSPALAAMAEAQLASFRIRLEQGLAELSRAAFQMVTNTAPPAGELRFSSADTISGRFVQLYFQAMSTGKNGGAE